MGMTGNTCPTAGKCSTVKGSWIPTVADHDSKCTAVEVRTNGKNCKKYCNDRGLACLRAQDNVGFGKCTLDARHNRQDQRDHGCNQNWKNQLCVCGTAKAAADSSNCPTAGKCSTLNGSWIPTAADHDL